MLTAEQAGELEAKHLPIINQSRGTRLFNDYGVSSNAPINSQSIIVYLLMCENSEKAARTVIHECTHRRYGIGQSQWAECVCFAQELKHKYKRDALTYSEKKRIIEAVQEGYPEYKWRKGGLIYGERQNHT